jgi:hypothetical protein
MRSDACANQRPVRARTRPRPSPGDQLGILTVESPATVERMHRFLVANGLKPDVVQPPFLITAQPGAGGAVRTVLHGYKLRRWLDMFVDALAVDGVDPQYLRNEVIGAHLSAPTMRLLAYAMASPPPLPAAAVTPTAHPDDNGGGGVVEGGVHHTEEGPAFEEPPPPADYADNNTVADDDTGMVVVTHASRKEEMTKNSIYPNGIHVRKRKDPAAWDNLLAKARQENQNRDSQLQKNHRSI